MIDYLEFYVPLKNISLIGRRHHYRWRAAKFRPMLNLRGAKWDTYDFVYKIDFCVDKSGFCTTKMNCYYHQLTKITFVMTKTNFVDKIHFCTQKSLLSWQSSFLSTKFTFVHKSKVLSRVLSFLLTKVSFVNKSNFCHDKSHFFWQNSLCLQKSLLSLQK